jgi:hypothetical protein
MASKNTLLGSGKVEEVVEPKVPIDELPNVALPTWMRHETKKSKLVNTKVEYYSAVDDGYVMAPGE